MGFKMVPSNPITDWKGKMEANVPRQVNICSSNSTMKSILHSFFVSLVNAVGQYWIVAPTAFT